MAFLRNAWYVAMWSHELGQAPVARRLLDEPVVLFRASGGRVGALADVCPHRFAPLSRGTCVGEDRIRCPYHGLEFDLQGACVRNPHPSGRPPAGARVRSHAAVERHGAIWVWMGDEPPDPSTLPDCSALDAADPEHVSARGFLRMQAGYTLVVENLLDLSHAVFLHEGILETADSVRATTEARQDGDAVTVRRAVEDTPSPQLQDLLFHRDGRRVDASTEITWRPPAFLVNRVWVKDVGAPHDTGTGFEGFHFLTPETERSTLYHFVAVRRNPIPTDERTREEIQSQLGRLRRLAFVEQDAPIIEAIQRNLDDPGADTDRPAVFEVDAGPARFQRHLARLLEAEAARRGTAR